MPPTQDSLYGQPRAKKTPKSEMSASSSLAFTSQLSSLIAQDREAPTSRGRTRPSKTPKSDIFAKHNKGALKRAAADLKDDNPHTGQKHQRSQDIGSVDDATLNRAKRRMAEKVRMYDELKSGVYLAADSDEDEDEPGRPESHLARLRRKEREGLVDFDQKWADERRKNGKTTSDSDDDNENDDNDNDNDDNASIISYEDELGRSRRGTRAAAARAARAKAEDEDRNQGRLGTERWRPARPDNLIYGEAIQSQAFNPDANIATHMSQLAARRDRSPTPPERQHYDADAEVRTRGTGFYAFSRDEDERQRQMEELKNARDETESQRRKWRDIVEKRERAREMRWLQILETRSERQALEFLNSLGVSGMEAQPDE
ncbi:hypothetical protein NUU61_004770 [Penicillium alfredii]|uniref:Uncharacterized protein n=1 Tax=Penicillium alfredii TaxID=1506179 RepID=A0A9W9K6Z6_9EURO|nr:uncharacterized protein NUU61_004770 [Penicillium alfredii]KAJ5095414.1 hypothetical protein NUU61_004770 [Penicillium alfredii]